MTRKAMAGRSRPLPPRGSAFDEGFQADESVVPLSGDEIEIFFEIFDGLEMEFEKALAAGADAADQAGAFEDAKMLGDGLAREARARGELRDRARGAGAELGDDGEARYVAKRGEDERVSAAA